MSGALYSYTVVEVQTDCACLFIYYTEDLQCIPRRNCRKLLINTWATRRFPIRISDRRNMIMRVILMLLMFYWLTKVYCNEFDGTPWLSLHGHRSISHAVALPNVWTIEIINYRDLFWSWSTDRSELTKCCFSGKKRKWIELRQTPFNCTIVSISNIFLHD